MRQVPTVGESPDNGDRYSNEDPLRGRREGAQVSPRHISVKATDIQFGRQFHSPKTNPNLLTRSEVVALINTLHRLSESLHAVRIFREMWAQTGDEDSERLIRDAEKAASTVGEVRSESLTWIALFLTSSSQAHDPTTDESTVPISSNVTVQRIHSELVTIAETVKHWFGRMISSFRVRTGDLDEL
jgi:hypothetical protein